MQRLTLIALATVIILATGFCALIFVSLVPHFAVIGLVATGVVIVLLCCVAALAVSFTWSQMGVWHHRRHTIVAGEVVAYVEPDGEIVHLSAEHEQAKVPLPAARALPEPKPAADTDTVLELYDQGNSLRDIVKLTNLSYYQVQKITSEKRENAS
jgi:phage terminase large subunit-like protein